MHGPLLHCTRHSHSWRELCPPLCRGFMTLYHPRPPSVSPPSPHGTCTWPRRLPAALQQHRHTAPAQTPHVPPALLDALKPGLFTLCKVEGQGRGLVATQAIPYASELLREAPVMSVAAAHCRHQVCAGCLAGLGSQTFKHPASGTPFCSELCMEVSSRRFHDVMSMTDPGALQQHCDRNGLRFPLLATRLAVVLLGQAAAREARQRLQPKEHDTTPGVTQGRQEPALRPVVQGDPADVVPFLAYAMVSAPYPPEWCEEHQLMVAGLQPAAQQLASQLVAAESQLAASSGAVAPAGVSHPDSSPADAASNEPVSSNQVEAVAQRLLSQFSLDWYAAVQSRIAINSFRVDTVLMAPGGGLGGWAGGQGADLGRMAAEMVLQEAKGAAGSGSTGGDVGAGWQGGATGSAVYVVGSLFNHSCEPNLDVVFPLNNHVVAFRAARDIEAGEQLSISYLDQSLPVQSRQQALQWGYGFQCRCALCVEELGLEGV